MAEGGRGAFGSLSESYENIVATLEEKGVPSPRTLLPVAGAIIIIAIALVLLPSLLNPTTTVEFKVLNSQNAPVAGADVTLSAGGKSFSSRSLADGSVSIENVPQQKEYEVSVSAAGYQPKPDSVQNGGQVRLSGTTSSQKKTLKIKVVGSDKITAVDDAAVALSFNDGTSLDKTTDDWGEALFDLTGITNKLATADVEKEGFESKTKAVNVEDGVITISLKETGEEKTGDATTGDFIVNAGVEAQGAFVSLEDPYTKTPLSQARVGADGKAVFPRLALNAKFVITASDPDGRFENYEDAAETVFTRNLQEESITLSRSKGAEDQLVITVKSKGGDRIQGAEVKLYDKNSKTLYAEDSTDAGGNAQFTVSGKTFYATAFKDGFAPGYAESTRRGDSKTIELEQAGEGNSVEATISVKENGEAAPDVEVAFFKANGFPLGIPSVFTSADGTAVFNMPLLLEGKSYKAYAVASAGNKVGRSDLVDVADGIDFVIVLQAPPANVTLVAKNLLTKERIANAVFSALTPADSIVKDCASPCTMELPSQVELRFAASASGYLQTTTAAVSFEPGESKTVEVLLYPLSVSKKNSLNFIGFFDRNGNNVAEFQRGETYKAKFMLSLADKGDASAFFQAGESADSASEPFALTGFKSALKPKTIFSGETADTVCAPEEKTQPESLKWIELGYSGLLGASEITLEFKAKQDAPASSEIKIFYRAGGFIGSSGIPFTSPQDDDLITQLLSQSSKDKGVFCNAKTSEAKAKVQAKPMVCKDGLCSRIVLEREDGFKSSNNLVVPIGKQFKMDFDLFAPDESIDSVSLGESDAFEIISGRAGEASFAEKTFTATGTEKTSGTIEMRALRQSTRSALKLKVSFASEKQPLTIERAVEISGTNSFQLSFSPSQAVLGESVRAQAIVLDALSRPVVDAEVTLSNCEDSPRAIQTKTVAGSNAPGAGKDGRYEFRFTPQTVGTLCVEARAQGFETKMLQAAAINAEDFLTLDKEAIAFTGPADEQTPIAVEVKIGLKETKVKIQASVNSECASLLSVVPAVKENAQESAQFNVRLNSFDAVEPTECAVTFLGEVNPATKATVILPVSISTTAGPDPEPQQCDASSCLAQSEAQALGCSPRSGFACADAGKSCFVCGSGLDGISDISLSINNLKNDRRVYPLFLNFDPKFNEEFDLVWDQQINTRSQGIPQGNYPAGGGVPYDAYINQQYGAQPFYSSNYPLGIGQGYSQNQYLPEYQNPIRTGVPPELLGTQYPYQQPNQMGFGYSQSQLAIPQQNYMQQGFGQTCGGFANAQCPQGMICDNSFGSAGQCIPTGGAYPGLQPNQPVVPPYCYNYFYNQQSSFNNQYSQIGFSSYTPGAPVGYPPQCQYPYICQNPQACGYIAGGMQGANGPLNSMMQQCQSGVGGQVQYKQIGQPFKLTVELGRAQLAVSAVYVGDEYFFAGGRTASARGFLIIRDSQGVEKKRVAITVEVSYSGSIPSQYPQGGFGIPPVGYPQGGYGGMPYGNQRNIPPECFALFYPPTQGTQGQLSLPQDMVVLTNAYTGKGQAEYAFDAPRTGKILCQSQTTVSSVSCSIGEVKETVETQDEKPAKEVKTAKKTAKPAVVLTAKESKARKEKESQGKATFTWSLQPQNKMEQSFTLKPDSFAPQKIQLLRFLENPDSAEFKVEGIKKENCQSKGEVAKITCDGENETIRAETSGLKTGTAVLTLRGLGDNQVREIPVVVSNIVQETFKIDASGKGENTIKFNPKLDYSKEGDNALGVGAPESIEGEKCNGMDAAMENNEIKITADCTNFVKGGKLQSFAVYYTVKLILPENAGGREITIPFLVSDKPIQFDFTEPVIIAPREATKGEQLTVKILYLVQDVESSRGAIAIGVSKDGKVRRQLAVANGSNAKTLSFKMVNTDGSTAEIRASTKTAAGKTLESNAKIGLSGEAPAAGQGKDEEKHTKHTVAAGTEGTGGTKVSGTGTTGSAAVQYGACTVKAGKKTKETSSAGTRVLSTGVANGLKGECGSVTQCVSTGGKAYSGFCPGTSSIQCCVDGKVDGKASGEAEAEGTQLKGILEAKVGTGGRGENFKETSGLGFADTMYGSLKVPLSLIPEGNFGLAVSFYYSKETGDYPAGYRAQSVYVNYKRDKEKFYWVKTDGTTAESASIKLVKLEGSQSFLRIQPAVDLWNVIDENGKWKGTDKPAESTYTVEFKIKKGDAEKGERVAYAKILKPTALSTFSTQKLNCAGRTVDFTKDTGTIDCEIKGSEYKINLVNICELNAYNVGFLGLGGGESNVGTNAFFRVKLGNQEVECADKIVYDQTSNCRFSGSIDDDDPFLAVPKWSKCDLAPISIVFNKWIRNTGGEITGVNAKIQ
ncbi:MAG TPA: carboxypeptidase regulatory-like domain-containing protein [Candidatus Norongarragalinales archaeon]|nr:carboxypeptidase regulatory-like domain-containing protein [Candidatus Norongarragalinales archaeon]